MQIRTKLTLQFTLLVSAILLLAFYSVYFFWSQRTEEAFFKRLRERAITSAILLLKVEQVDSALLKTIDLSKHDVLYRENISIFNESNKEIYTNYDSVLSIQSSKLFNSIRTQGEVIFKKGDFDVVGVPFTDQGQRYVLIAEAVDRDGHLRMNSLRKLLAVLFTLMIAIVAGAGWVYAGRALQPIKEIMDEVQSISTANLGRRLHGAEKPDEIGKLISIFNSLLSRIENAFTLQKTFVSNVSHELKNPLTKITSQLEVTLLNDRRAEEYREIIKSVLEDIKELNQLSTSLLDLASLSQEHVSFAKQRVRIDEILWEVRESVQALNLEYKVDVHTVEMPDNEEDLYLDANPYLLKTALQNLIENACKFSNDKMATVSLICSKAELEIRIFDNGPGIAKQDLHNIFEPFYRANNTSRIRGHGIGLSLSQRIIMTHNGVVDIDSTIGEGTQVTVIFFK
jgi:signal transduction histidine kinase